MDYNRCGTCRHFASSAKECRRFPPSWAMWPNDNQYPITYTPYANYVSTSADTPSCGEWSDSYGVV